MASVMRNAFYRECEFCKTESEKKKDQKKEKQTNKKQYENQQQQQGVIHT